MRACARTFRPASGDSICKSLRTSSYWPSLSLPTASAALAAESTLYPPASSTVLRVRRDARSSSTRRTLASSYSTVLAEWLIGCLARVYPRSLPIRPQTFHTTFLVRSKPLQRLWFLKYPREDAAHVGELPIQRKRPLSFFNRKKRKDFKVRLDGR